MRAAASAVASGRRGLAIGEIDVPDYAADGPALSGVALTSLPAVLAITSGSAPPLARLGASPSAAGAFAIGDRITAAFHVYPGHAASERLSVVARVEAVGHEAGQLPSTTATASGDGDPAKPEEMAFEFDTAALPPGRYVMRITLAAASSRGDVASSHAIPFLLTAR